MVLSTGAVLSPETGDACAVPHLVQRYIEDFDNAAEAWGGNVPWDVTEVAGMPIRYQPR